MANLVAYIDGFNLYYGLKAKYGRKYLWLDLQKLAQNLRATDDLVAVKYFTTIVAGEPEAARRQENYLAALAAHSPLVQVIRGRFKKKQPICFSCRQHWLCQCVPPQEYRTYEEKLTDVALGVAMVEDTALGVGDATMLISTDTDIHPAIHASTRIAPKRSIYLACPPGRMPTKQQFSPNVTSFLIGEKPVAAAQLPEIVPIRGGKQQTRPDKWQ